MEFILKALGFIMAIGGIILFLNSIYDRYSKQFTFKKSKITGAIMLVLGGIIIWIVGAGIVIVDAGQRHVVWNTFTGVKEKELEEGLNVIIPLVERTIPYSVRIEEYTMTSTVGEGDVHGSDELWSPTKEGLKIGIDLTVLYRLHPDSCDKVHQQLGQNFTQKIIRPTIRSNAREIIMKFKIVDVIENREIIEGDITERIKTSLEPKGIMIEDVLLRDLKYTPDFARSIEQKQIAEQDAKKMEFVLEKEEKEARRKKISAQGDSMAIHTVRRSLTPDYIKYLYVKGISENDKLKVIVTDQETIMDLKGMTQ